MLADGNLRGRVMSGCVIDVVMKLSLILCTSLAMVGCNKPPNPPLSGSAASLPAAGSATQTVETMEAEPDSTLTQLTTLTKGKGLQRDDMTVKLENRDGKWVTATGQIVPEENVIDGGAISWSPDKKWAVVFVNEGCGDMCHMGAWLVGASGVRELDGDQPNVAWNPKRPEVAIEFENGDSFKTEVIDLNNLGEGEESIGTVFATYHEPSYTADGVLTLKNKKGVVHTVGADGKLKKR